MKKLNLTQIISCKILAVLLIALVFVTIFPLGVFAEDVVSETPFIFDSVESIEEITVDNNLSIKEISKKLPQNVSVWYAKGEELLLSEGHAVQWDIENVVYDQKNAEEQIIVINGTVTLDEKKVVNLEQKSLQCNISVKVKAAEPINFNTNLDNSESLKKKTGEKFSLTVEVLGTVEDYQWYHRAEGTSESKAIEGANDAEYKVTSLSLEDAGTYYCVVTGKGGDTLTSNEISVSVKKSNYFDKLYKTFIEKNGLKQIFNGLGNTLLITAGALVIGVIIGIIIAVAKYFSEDVPVLKPISWVCDIYVTVIRGIPVTVLLIITFFVIMSSVKNGIIPAIITFGINSGAYMAEIIRSGINAVDKGQMEAGRSLGLTKLQTMSKIILPQAIRYILPAIGNEFIALLKETSVAGYVAVEDLTRKGNIVSNNTYDVMNPRLLVALIYLVLVVILTQILTFVERRLAKSDKR